jgi:hypothetical protein
MGKEWDRLGLSEGVANQGRPVTSAMPDASQGADRASGHANPLTESDLWDTHGGDGSHAAQTNRKRRGWDGYGPRPNYAAGIKAQNWHQAWATEALRVLKPGGHLLAFGGTRTYHRLACAVEDAGFEIRDSLIWLYLSGFPKAWNFETQYPADGWCECPGEAVPYNHVSDTEHGVRSVREAYLQAAVFPEEEQGEVLLEGVPEQGASAYWEAGDESEDGGRGESSVEGWQLHRAGKGLPDGASAEASEGESERLRLGAHLGGGGDVGALIGGGRGDSSHQPGPNGQPTGEPADLHQPQEALDDGALRDGGRCPRCGKLAQGFRGFSTALKPGFEPLVLARKPLAGSVASNVEDWGTGAMNTDASRLDGGRWPANAFLCPKSSRGERNAGLEGFEEQVAGGMSARADGSLDGHIVTARNVHPTVKPIELMRWLVRLVTPPGGLVLDPFAGSGTTGCAAVLEGFDFVGIEREPEYVEIAKARIAWWEPHAGRSTEEVLIEAGFSERDRRERIEAGQLGMFDLAPTPVDGNRDGEPTAEKRYTEDGASNFAMKPGRRRRD